MSVIVTIRVPANPAKFREFANSNQDKLRTILEDAKSKGCLHHRFALGESSVLVVDEWETAEGFQSFFQGNHGVAEAMAAAEATGEPYIAFDEAIDTADKI